MSAAQPLNDDQGATSTAPLASEAPSAPTAPATSSAVSAPDVDPPAVENLPEPESTSTANAGPIDLDEVPAIPDQVEVVGSGGEFDAAAEVAAIEAAMGETPPVNASKSDDQTNPVPGGDADGDAGDADGGDAADDPTVAEPAEQAEAWARAEEAAKSTSEQPEQTVAATTSTSQFEKTPAQVRYEQARSAADALLEELRAELRTEGEI